MNLLFKKNMSDLIEKVMLLQNILIARATGKQDLGDNEEFLKLRKDIIGDNKINNYLPIMIKTSRSLDQFWGEIKKKFDNYADRRTYIYSEFNQLLEFLENYNTSPSDQIVINTIEKLSSDYIHQIWHKALERRSSDPDGAITLARTLLESTCKYILDDMRIDYGNTPDINHLYRLVSNELNLAPSQHTEKVFKQILGGCNSVVEGLGALRNKVGDAHGQGKKNFRPSARHAELAVNLAGTMAVFLFSSWNIKAE